MKGHHRAVEQFYAALCTIYVTGILEREEKVGGAE